MRSEDTRPGNYDKVKFKEFLAGQSLQKLHHKAVVLVVGPMGAGKSTTIGVQQGSIYEKNPAGRGYRLKWSSVYTPATSDGFTSKTLNIGAYEDPDSQLLYLDTAGLDENRGKEEKLWTQSSLDILFSIVGEIESILVVMDYGVTFGARAGGFYQLAENLAKITMGNEIFYQSMVFVVTHGYRDGDKISITDLIYEAGKMLDEKKQQEHEFKARLARNYPLNIKDRTLAVVGGRVGREANPDNEIKFNINDVPDLDKQQLHQIIATRKLLNTFVTSQGKIILSYPDGENACRILRQETLQKIRPPIAEERQLIEERQLRDLARNHLPSNRLLLQNILSLMASEYLGAGLSQEADLLVQLQTYYIQKRGDFDAIEQDWKAVKRRLITEKEREIRDKRAAIGGKQEELDRLQSSTTPVVYSEQPILKERNGGFWGINSSC